MTQKEFVFKLKDKEDVFSLTFSNENIPLGNNKIDEDSVPPPTKEGNTLGINIIEVGSVPPVSYSSKFSLTELTKLSRYFRLFESIEELLPELNNICNQNQVKIEKQKESVNLILSLPLKIMQEVFLPIPLDKADPNKVIISLGQSVNDLNKKIKSLMIGEIPEEELEENLKSKDILQMMMK